MNNPYDVLGVRQNASEREIKAAYKDLVKKYHPDKYQNNPLADLAEEKLQEINEAYDYLTKNKGGAAAFNSGQGYGSSDNSSGVMNQKYNQIRVALDRGDLLAAEQMLIHLESRDAQWYFLSGVLSYKKGWYDDALSNISAAISMDPNNMEYKRIYQQMLNSGGIYQQRSSSQGYSNSDDCLKFLQCYICTDCLCPCF
ncbi:MAG: DnaJ domain-containing protein [Eubacteriales bacterium]|nr:DnaJ domain-containing protein [Eubacteriales bacterium]